MIPTQKKKESTMKMKMRFRVLQCITILCIFMNVTNQNERFGDKVIRSFVKVKNDPRDCIAYQILHVTCNQDFWLLIFTSSTRLCWFFYFLDLRWFWLFSFLLVYYMAAYYRLWFFKIATYNLWIYNPCHDHFITIIIIHALFFLFCRQ